MYWLLCLFVVGAHAAAPVIVSQKTRFANLKMPDFEAEVVLIEVQFDKEVNAMINGSPVSLADLNGVVSVPGGGSMPSIMRASGVGQMSCATGSLVFHAVDPTMQQDGPPTDLMLAPPSDEPGADLISQFGGWTFPSEKSRTKVVFALILSGTSVGANGGSSVVQPGSPTRANFASLKCKINFPDATRPKALVDSDGVAFVGSTALLTPTTYALTIASANRMEQSIVNYNTALSNVTSREQARSIGMLSGTISMMEAWGAFFDLISTFYTASVGTLTGESGKSCVFPSGTFEFATSPCCNQSLAFTQCCVSTPVAISYQSFNDISVTGDQCHYPSAVEAVVIDFLQANQYYTVAKASAPVNPDTLWQTLQSFMSQCNTALYGNTVTCTQDSQCSYGLKCDTHMGQCTFDFSHPENSLAACYIEKMDARLMAQMVLLWELNPSSSTFAADFAAKLVELASESECVGMSSDRCRSTQTSVKDANGNFYSVHVPANQTCCLLPQGCNWADRQSMTQTECTGAAVIAAKGANFCGVSFGNTQLQDITQLPTCIIPQSRDQASCASLGGAYTWVASTQGGGFGGGAGACYRLDLNSSSLCLSDPVCSLVRTAIDASVLAGTFNPFSGSANNDQDCSNELCYAVIPRVNCTAFQNLNTAQPLSNIFWNARLSLCQVSISGDSSVWKNQTRCNPLTALTGYNFTYHQGRQYTPGQWSNPTDCAVGRCSHPQFSYFGITSTQCATHTQCTQPCERCRSPQADSTGNEQRLCYDPAIQTQMTCQGQWTQTSINGTQKSYCAYALARAACVAAGFTFKSCDDFSTSATCAALPTWEYQALHCQWNPWDMCQTTDACLAQGQCDDYEFNPCMGSAPGSSCVEGACVQAWQIDTRSGQRQWCQDPLQQSRIGCVDKTIQTAGACTAKGSTWKWHAKATTLAQCAAHGSQCLSADWRQGYSARPSEQCSMCGGTTSNVYRFTSGAVAASTQIPATWQARAWGPVNQFITTISYSKLNDLFNEGIALVLSKIQQNAFNSQYGPLVPAIKAIACACGDVTGVAPTHCFDAVAFTDVSCLASKGKGSICSGPNGAVQLSSTSVSSDSGTELVQKFVPAGFLIASQQVSDGLTGSNAVVRMLGMNLMVETATKTLFRPTLLVVGNSNTYAIVKNAEYSAVVGQLISNGYVLPETSGVTYPFVLCITLNLNINQDNITYSVPDFANGTNITDGTFVVGSPLGLVTNLTATQACAPVPASGVYFAILRVPNYASVGAPVVIATPGTTFTSADIVQATVASATTVFAFALGWWDFGPTTTANVAYSRVIQP